MPVGTTSDFDVTRDELIDLAFSLIGVSEVSKTDRTLAKKVLNSLMRHLDARGTWLHTVDNTESTLTLVANQQEYVTGTGANNIADNMLKLETCAVYINDHEWLTILDKPMSLRTPLMDDSTGQPEAVHFARAKLTADNVLLFYPTPNAAYTVKYTFRRPLFDFDGATDNPDFPGPFILPLQKMLGAELAPHYGIPLQERQFLKAEGMGEFELAKADLADRPSYTPLKMEYF